MMASPPTADPQGNGADSEEEEDKGKGKRSFKRRVMNSRVVKKVTGEKKYSSGVTPTPEGGPGHVKASTSKRSSDLKHQPLSGATGTGHKKNVSGKQQPQDAYTIPPPPPGQDQHQTPTTSPTMQAFERERSASTPSAQPTYAPAGAAIFQQPLSSHYQQPQQYPPVGASLAGYDHLQGTTTQHATDWPPTGALPHQPDHAQLKEEKEGVGPSDPQIRQQLRKLEIRNDRLEKDKAALQEQVCQYEDQLAVRDEQLQQLQSAAQARAGRLPQMVTLEEQIRQMTEKQAKLEISFVTRDAQLTQLDTEKALLQQQLQEALTNCQQQDGEVRRIASENQALVAGKEAAAHSLEIAQDKITIMEKEILKLTEQLKVEKEKKGQALSSKEQQLQEKVEKLTHEVTGMKVEKAVSQEATRKQFDSLKEHYEREVRSAQEEVDKATKQKHTQIHQLRGELQELQSQLEEKNKEVMALEETKRLLEAQLKEEKDKKDTELAEKKQKAEIALVKQQEVETLQQQLKASREEAAQSAQLVAELTEMRRKSKEKYKTKLAELQQQLAEREDWAHIGHACQTSDGAGASPVTSLEEKQKVEVDLKEELAVKDHQLAELKEKIENHEVRDKLLEDTKARLESQLKEMQLELNQQLEKKGADYRGLQEHSTARGQEIVSLNEKLEELQNELAVAQDELAVAQIQAQGYKEDFEQERRDRERAHGMLQDMKEQSSVRLQARIKELETKNKALNQHHSLTADVQRQLAQIEEDYQVSQSQIRAYKKQVDTCKKELEDERRRAQLLQERIDVLNGLQEEMSRLRAELEEEMRQAQEHSRQLQQQVEEERHSRHEAEQDVERLQIKVMEATTNEGRGEHPLWMVRREEVMMTGKVKGAGAYGEVKEATFRGLHVVAKILHETIISDFNLEKFHREMSMAANVRHPNLLQFIGAVTEGTPIILTELMPTNLWSQLQCAPLPKTQILSISQDVSLALNYLHLFRPDPIIHRDISSSNVLLEPTPTGWRAKVSDFGSANFRSRATTAGPGTPDYSAPESRYPDDHSPKMDVFSFGVLLIEMVLHQSPGATTAEKNRQVSEIQWTAMSSLVRQCLSRSYSVRPSMENVLIALRGMATHPQ